MSDEHRPVAAGDEHNERLSQIEAKLVEQEHRAVSILLNFAAYGFSRDHPKQRAAWWALAHFLVLGRAAALGVTVVAIAGLWISYRSNGLLREQNHAVLEQVRQSRAQNRFLIEQFRAERDGERMRVLIAAFSFILTTKESLEACATALEESLAGRPFPTDADNTCDELADDRWMKQLDDLVYEPLIALEFLDGGKAINDLSRAVVSVQKDRLARMRGGPVHARAPTMKRHLQAAMESAARAREVLLPYKDAVRARNERILHWREDDGAAPAGSN